MKPTLLRTALISASLLAYAPAAMADAETEALRAQIKLLEARLEQLEKRQAASVSTPARNHPTGGNLEQRLAIVERKQENAEETARTQKSPSVEIGSKGLSVTSPDKQYSLRMRAYGQVSSRTFLDNSNTSDVDTFLVRSARPIIEAQMTDYFSGRLMMDFAGSNTRLLDAYMDFKPVPDSKLARLRLGKFKSPLGLERWQSEQELLFAERGQTTNLVPFRDTGVMVLGELVPGKLEYQLSYGNGTPDLGDSNRDADNHGDVSARLFAHPLPGFGIGLGGSYGTHTGNAAASNLTTGYLSMGQSRYFTYNAGSYADGDKWRLNPQAYYYNGPFSLLGEYVATGQDVSNGVISRNLRHDAWSAIATYVLTGEDASFDGVKPDNNFDWQQNHWGAFELTARAGALRIDSNAFGAFSNLNSSAKGAQEGALGLNWYLNNSVKFNLNYARTYFDGGAAGGVDRQTEDVILTQTQFRF
jgi:phosphate-selective porin OprO/OprP